MTKASMHDMTLESAFRLVLLEGLGTTSIHEHRADNVEDTINEKFAEPFPALRRILTNHRDFVPEAFGSEIVFHFILDSVDEVSVERAKKITNELYSMTQTWKNHNFLVAIRTSASEDLLDDNVTKVFGVYHIQPLIESDIVEYLGKKLKYSKDEANELWSKFSERTRALTKTPLLLWMLTKVIKSNDYTPRFAQDLYNIISNNLFMDYLKNTLATNDVQTSDANISMSFVMLSKRLELLAIETFFVENSLQRVDVTHFMNQKSLEILTEIGFIESGETIAFGIHHTFQSYFASLGLLLSVEEALRNGESKITIRNKTLEFRNIFEQSKWKEVVVVLAGLMHDTLAEKWISHIWKVDKLLAMECLNNGVSHRIPSKLKDELTQSVDDWFLKPGFFSKESCQSTDEYSCTKLSRSESATVYTHDSVQQRSGYA